MRPQPRPFAKKLFAAAALIALLLGSAEALLRLSGFFAQAPAEKMNEIQAGDATKLRILTLGESTTADFFAPGPRSAWPRQLEDLLVAGGLNARVYNVAVSGTSTPFILAKIEGQLDQYRPHIVISMIGTNDVGGLVFDDSFANRWRMWFRDLRVSKLAGWAAGRISGFGQCKVTYSILPVVPREIAAAAFALGRAGQFAKIEELLRPAYPDPKARALALAKLAYELREDLGEANLKEGPLATGIALEALRLDPLEYAVAFQAIQIINSQTSVPASVIQEVADSIFACASELQDELVLQMFYDPRWDAALAAADIVNQRALKRLENQAEATRYNYRSLAAKILARGIPLIAMQYPNEKLEWLESYFHGSDGKIEPVFHNIVFVGNEANFAQASKEHRFEELYIDRFHGNWGHTTSLGHGLIARAVEQKIKGLMIENRAFAPFRTSPGRSAP